MTEKDGYHMLLAVVERIGGSIWENRICWPILGMAHGTIDNTGEKVYDTRVRGEIHIPDGNGGFDTKRYCRKFQVLMCDLPESIWRYENIGIREIRLINDEIRDETVPSASLMEAFAAVNTLEQNLLEAKVPFVTNYVYADDIAHRRSKNSSIRQELELSTIERLITDEFIVRAGIWPSA